MDYYQRVKTVQSKLTSQGQISVPAEVRRRLGIGPGSIIEWKDEGEKITVSRAKRYSFDDIHRDIFDEPPEPKTLEELKESIADLMRERYGRD